MRADFSDVTLVSEAPDHEHFLFLLYASSRQEELEAWGWPEEARKSFLTVQFKAQQNFRATNPRAQSWIVLRASQPIGRLLVLRDETEVRLLDISLLLEFRNQGIGSMLIRRLMAEASADRKPFRLHVRLGHRAAGLYQRLGLKRIGGTELHDDLEATTVSNKPEIRN